MDATITPKKGTHVPEDWQDRFLDALADSGNVSHSAGRAGVSRTFAYRYYQAHPEFALLWEEAIKASNVVLEDEARRRAVDGVERRRVYRKGDTEIEEVETRYSDTLLIFLMKGNMPDKYRENINLNANVDARVNHSGSVHIYIPQNNREAEGSDQGE
jgi:hypothetical protein